MASKVKRDDGRRTTTVEAAIGDAFSGIEGLKDELQDWFDNLPEGFQNGSKGEQLTEAIDALEQDSEPSDVHELVAGLQVDYRETVGRKAKSRRAQRDNLVAMLSAASDVVRNRASELQDLSEEAYDQAGKKAKDADAELPDTLGEMESAIQEVESLADELDEAVSNWENAEFPGMYG